MRERGVDVVINIYDGVGSTLAEAAEHRWPAAALNTET